MKKIVSVVLMAALMLGCAKVRMEAPKDPIKLDITMRLDVYQHVSEDIDKIENIVTGKDDKPKDSKGGDQSFLSILVTEAYAQEELSPELKEAAFRRKDNRINVEKYLKAEVIAESKSGLLIIRNNDIDEAIVKKLVADENKDRMIIYKNVAQNNGITVEEVQKIYAKKLQSAAPQGSWVEVKNAEGDVKWKQK